MSVSDQEMQAAGDAIHDHVVELRQTLWMVLGKLTPGDDEPGSAWADFSHKEIETIERVLGRRPDKGQSDA